MVELNEIYFVSKKKKNNLEASMDFFVVSKNEIAGFRNVEEIVSDWQEQKQNSSEKISRIESELLQLKNQLDLDKTVEKRLL